MLKKFLFDKINYDEITLREIINFFVRYNYTLVCDGDGKEVRIEDFLYLKDSDQPAQ